jgi:hypothetical protein
MLDKCFTTELYTPVRAVFLSFWFGFPPFETGSFYVAQSVLETSILLPQPPESELGS